MKNRKKITLVALLINVLSLTICSAVEADVTFGEISITPESPSPQSTITISTTISGDIPTQVKVIVEECNETTGICYSDVQNVSMSPVNEGNYQTSVTLKHADATYINCTILAEINDTWISSPNWKKVYLSSIPNGNVDGDDNEDKGTPGFELILVLTAIGISLMLIGKKRRK
jgi:hypothetical protein